MNIMTLNLQFYADGHGAWDVRRELIVETIRDHGADIVVLQAVARDPGRVGGVDQAAQLAALLDYRHVRFEAARTTEEGRQEGMGVIARLEMDDEEPYRLSLEADPEHAEDPSARLVLAARLGPLTLFNAHFSWVSSQAASNVTEALPYLRRFDGPCLLLGDLNTDPGTSLLQPFVQDGWTDLWAWSRPDDPGYTFDARKPDRRIDYAWGTGELRTALKGIEVVGARPNRHRAYLSDHLGLLVTLSD